MASFTWGHRRRTAGMECPGDGQFAAEPGTALRANGRAGGGKHHGGGMSVRPIPEQAHPIGATAPGEETRPAPMAAPLEQADFLRGGPDACSVGRVSRPSQPAGLSPGQRLPPGPPPAGKGGVTQRVWQASLYPGLIAAWAALVIYGSLLPFDQRLPAHVHSLTDFVAWLPRFLASPHWNNYYAPWTVLLSHSTERRSDLALNLLLYFPLGGLLRMHQRQRGRRGWGWLMWAMGGTLALSWTLECAQGLSPSRMSNLTDVVSNEIGAWVGYIVALPAAYVLRRVCFWVYCRLAYPLHRARLFLGRERKMPGVALILAAVNLVLLAAWLHHQSRPGGGHHTTTTNWLPFLHQFDEYYNRAVEGIAQTLVLYLLLAVLAAIQFLSVRRRRGFGMVLVTVTVLALVIQAFRRWELGRGFDITEPVLAVTAAGLLMVGVLVFVRSVKAQNRRQAARPVAVERRRVR